MNYNQPKIEKRICIKARLAKDGQNKEYKLNHENINGIALESMEYECIISIISQDFYHFLKSKNILGRKVRLKVVNCINIFIKYLSSCHKKTLNFYSKGIIQDFLYNWYPDNYSKVTNMLISEMSYYILYFYEFLLSLDWLYVHSYNNIKKEVCLITSSNSLNSF